MKLFIRAFTFIIVSAAMAMTIGCSQNHIEKKLADPDMQGEGGVTVVGLDESLHHDYLRVTIEFKNKKSKNAHIYYRIRWLDVKGNVLKADAPWKQILVYGKRNLFVTDTAPDARAVDYKLEINSDK